MSARSSAAAWRGGGAVVAVMQDGDRDDRNRDGRDDGEHDRDAVSDRAQPHPRSSRRATRCSSPEQRLASGRLAVGGGVQLAADLRQLLVPSRDLTPRTHTPLEPSAARPAPIAVIM